MRALQRFRVAAHLKPHEETAFAFMCNEVVKGATTSAHMPPVSRPDLCQPADGRRRSFSAIEEHLHRTSVASAGNVSPKREKAGKVNYSTSLPAVFGIVPTVSLKPLASRSMPMSFWRYFSSSRRTSPENSVQRTKSASEAADSASSSMNSGKQQQQEALAAIRKAGSSQRPAVAAAAAAAAAMASHSARARSASPACRGIGTPRAQVLQPPPEVEGLSDFETSSEGDQPSKGSAGSGDLNLDLPATLPFARCGRRNSQAIFADPSQTMIIFDWDDTLFPSTHLRHIKGFSLCKPVHQQRLAKADCIVVARHLSRLEEKVHVLLEQATRLGRVVLVTLARAPWVHDACARFFPRVGKLIKQRRIKIVYAQDTSVVDDHTPSSMSDDEFEEFWARMKGRAITKELDHFYSQYEGQSWKNVISVGDSTFERLGTIRATEAYMRDLGIDVPVERIPTPTGASAGHVARVPSVTSTRSGLPEVEVDGQIYKVRTKTCKIIDDPSMQELAVELDLLHHWLPLLVALDDGFDCDLNDLDDAGAIAQIESTLRGS